MCATCGCGDGDAVRVRTVHAHAHSTGDAHDHDHGHGHGHDHARDHDRSDDAVPSRTRSLEIDILAKNDGLAADNRRLLAAGGVTALNLMSSPGAGKTTLLVRTLTDLRDELPVAVVEGDQETVLDADRIHATGVPVIQVNTGAGCHLDADMLRRALVALNPGPGTVLFVENVGNLVCPALFDLGEAAKVVVISVTEGDDKPLKYPQMFAGADLLVVNKSDLLPYVDFDVARCLGNARRVNPRLESVVVSATAGSGLADWYGWLRRTRSLTGSEDRSRQ